jgi:GGDEF domain-containing protein
LRASVEAMGFHIDDQLIYLTISIGVHLSLTQRRTPGVIEIADAALYQQKPMGVTGW